METVNGWTRTTDRRPPPGTDVLTYFNGDETWGHGHYDLDHGWLFGCECFRGRGQPDYWIIPCLPDSAGETHES
jgi:hypothetical protein